MADEIKETIPENTETTEAQSVPTENVEEPVVPDSSGNEPDDGVGFVKKMMGKLKSFGGKPEPDEEYIDIPQEFYDVAQGQGWTDKEIMDFVLDDGKSIYTDEELVAMIPILLGEEELSEPETPATEKETPSPDDEPIPKSEIEALKEEIRKEFQAEISELRRDKEIRDEQQQNQYNQAMLREMNRAFDEAGKEFEIFGQTDKLPVFPAGPKKGQLNPYSPQVKARQEVVDKAVLFIDNGSSIEDAMEDALTWYKGKYLKEDIHKNVIKELKGKEKKLSAKRSSKETTPTFEDEEEYQKDFVLKQAERLGIKIADD